VQLLQIKSYITVDKRFNDTIIIVKFMENRFFKQKGVLEFFQRSRFLLFRQDYTIISVILLE